MWSKLIILVCLAIAQGVHGQVNGNWGDWGNWSPCSVTCLNGTSSRTRACDNPAPSNGGTNCAGSDTESQDCIVMNYCLPSVNGNMDKACTFPNEFACATGVVNCIDIANKCDGSFDCEDGSDENPYFTDCPEVRCFGAAADIKVSLLTTMIMVVIATWLTVMTK